MIHSAVATAANVHDLQVLEDLLHGEETRVWSDSAYTGQKQVLHENVPNAKDFTQHKGSRHHRLTNEERSRNRNKSSVRSKVEHIFHVMRRQFGFTKVHYRGLDKNGRFLFVNCALINPVMAKKQLLRISQVTCA
jgi:IS5 family transposase